MAHREMMIYLYNTGSSGEDLEPQRRLLGLKATCLVAQVIPSPQSRDIVKTLVKKLCLNLQMSLYSKFFGHQQSLENKVKIHVLMNNPDGRFDPSGHSLLSFIPTGPPEPQLSLP